LIFSVLLATTNISSQDYFTGALIDTIGDKMILKKDMPVSRGGLPSFVSLKKYAPAVLLQKESSCVGWASTYAGFTIIQRIETASSIGPFSPLSTYNKIAVPPDSTHCDNGAHTRKAIELLAKQGAPKFKDYINSCRLDNQSIQYPNKLYMYDILNLDSRGVSNIKEALYKNQPVVISMDMYKMKTGESSLWRKYVSNSGEWLYNPKHVNSKDGGHAMCIIGYDDNKFGGAFEVMNSWGTSWGLDGFFWVKYSQMKPISEAFSLYPKQVASDLFTTNHIEFENQTNKDLFIAISYTGYNGTISRGWEKASAHSTGLINISGRHKNQIYWFATEQYGNWYSGTSADYTDINGKKIIINSSSSFKNHGNKFSYSSKNKGAIKFTPNEKDNINTIVINKKESKRKGRYHINYGEYMLSTNLIELLNGDINVEYEEMKFDRRKDCFTSSFRVPFRFKYMNYKEKGVSDVLRTGIDYKYFLNQKRSKTKFFVGGGEHFGMSIEKDVENNFRKRYFFNETLISTGVSYQLLSNINLTFDISSGWGLRNFSNSYIPFNYGLKIGYRN